MAHLWKPVEMGAARFLVAWEPISTNVTSPRMVQIVEEFLAQHRAEVNQAATFGETWELRMAVRGLSNLALTPGESPEYTLTADLQLLP